MRSLFLKIFFSFWLVIILMGVPFYLIGLKNRPEHPFPSMHDFSMQALARYGEEALAAWNAKGPEGLRTYAENIEHQSGISIYLFDSQQHTFSGREAPAEALAQVERIIAGQDEEPPKPGDPGERWIGRRLDQTAKTVGEGSIIVLRLPQPPHPPFPPLARNPLEHIGLFSLVGGLVCYFLARSLTSPIRKLREATNRIAGGDFSVRVSKDMGRKGNEVADLGRDFDTMAARIEGLLISQQRLLRDISHELRSPLARLNVALELARQRAGENANQALDRIEKESKRLNELIGQLMTLTVLESGAQELEKTSIDLAALLSEVTADADFEAATRNCRVILATDCLDGNRAVLHGSQELLRRAFENVIRNSVRYSGENSRVEINCSRSVEGEKGFAVIKVRDHGSGVPEWCLQHLFKPFFRVAEARDRQSGGTGLGLAIAERAVRLHGGSMQAVNAQQGGLIVIITLPLTRS